MKPESPASLLPNPNRPALWKIFSTFLALGFQSFGGGSATYLLIHQACISEGWLTEAEFLRDWALAQIAPGINLVKLTVLIGHRLRGGFGVASAMAGLLLPSALITVVMTAGFGFIRELPLVKAAMRGILPAAIGLSLAMSFQMAQPLISQAYKEGLLRLSINIFILVAAGLLLAAANYSPLIVLLLAGAAATLALAIAPDKTKVSLKKEQP